MIPYGDNLCFLESLSFEPDADAERWYGTLFKSETPHNPREPLWHNEGAYNSGAANYNNLDEQCVPFFLIPASIYIPHCCEQQRHVVW